MKNNKRLIDVEDAISLLEKDIAENKDALQHAYHGDKEAIREEINGVRRAIHIIKHHASHGGTVDAVEVVRCKDCKHLYCCSAVDREFYCRHPKGLKGMPNIVEENPFCPYGERKGND